MLTRLTTGLSAAAAYQMLFRVLFHMAVRGRAQHVKQTGKNLTSADLDARDHVACAVSTIIVRSGSSLLFGKQQTFNAQLTCSKSVVG
jgi:hypothetical protein